ncbi:cupin domain-containing protein [Actinokineospora inagensis]|uniref:cupin domain-containing protein n=1 Tax=Actinokineospora inagensis TaxID=103730 RepID=UPI000403423F|nr:cupin domain-containing protein [Actinokineospora inagensis]
MPLSTLADAPVFERPGFVFRPLAAPSRGSAELAIWTLEVAPGATSDTHELDREEVFVVRSGHLTVTVGTEEHTAGPGDAVIVPAHTRLSVRNASPDSPATATAVTSVGVRAGMDGASFEPPWAL